MLHGNLSTRPFYNERLVHLALAVLALAAVLWTAINVRQILVFSASRAALSAQADEDERRAAELDGSSAAIQRGINAQELELVVEGAREANTLIDQRTFSWTELFNHIETTLPPDVMIASVRPDVKEGIVGVSIVVVSRSVEQIDAFIERLEATGAFHALLSRQEEATDDGMYRAMLGGEYRSSRGDAAVQAAKAGGAP
jgi:hypothetical protein